LDIAKLWDTTFLLWYCGQIQHKPTYCTYIVQLEVFAIRYFISVGHNCTEVNTWPPSPLKIKKEYHQGKWNILIGVQTVETTIFENTYLRPHSFETCFLLWLFQPTQNDILSFLVFHFSVKNWNNCGTSVKETGRNAKHILLWLGLNDISKVQRSLPNPRYEEFSGLCGVLKCEYI